MGLFDRKRTNYSESQPLYTIGNSKNLLVIGLGNVGKEYTHNRHNLGFMAIDTYKNSHEFSEWIEKKDLKCYQATGNVGSTRVILIKPTTMMNLSGDAVFKVQNFYKIDSSDTLAIYDELDIDFGTIRTRTGGASAGHNGVKSLIKSIGDNFDRIRVGIGPKTHTKMNSADFVLQDFSEDQKKVLPKIIREVCAVVDERTVGQLNELTLKVE